MQGSVSAGAAAQVDSSAIVTGTVQGGVPSPQTTRLSWEVQPGLNFGYPVHLEPESRLNLEGGVYGDLSLKSRSTLYLRTGTYVFENVRVEPDATLFIDSSEGPVQIYVQSSFGFRGIVRSATHQDPQLLFAYQGTEPIFIEAPYLGVVLAPQAEIRLQAARPEGHVGVFHGSRVLLGPDTKIQSPRFNWSQIVDDPALVEPLDGPEHWLHASPSRVSITAEGWREGTPTGSASWTTGDDYEFELKDELEVDGGIIGNGTLLLSYVDSSGRSQYCSYRGQLPKGQPSTLEEFALARTLRLVSCTDGLDASARRRSGSFSLQVTGTPSFPVSVSPPITRDGACSEQLELLSAEQTVRMRESFSWEKAQKVVEYNEDGSPTLYFGWVYVRDQEELAAYRKLLIHQLNRPLFERDLEKFAGRCGVTTNPGDGEGTFVPSIIVGATYNRLIDAIHSDEIEGDKVLFDAVILGETPAEIQAAGGSISYQALAQAGIKYLNRRTAQGLSSQIELDGGAAKVFLDVTAWVVEAAVNITETALEFLGEIDELFRGDIDIDVGIFSFVPDPAFYKGDKKSTVTEFLKSRPKPMVRAWGQYRGYELGAQDMQVTLMQKMFGSFIPSESKGFTDKTGRARLDVVSGETRGNGLCFELKSQGAQISDYLLAKEICDFRGFAQNDLQIFGDFRLNRITEAQTKFPIVVDHPGLTGLYQSDDVHQWARSVMGYATKRARVLSGYWATTLSPTTNISMPDSDEKRRGLYASCLNFANKFSDDHFALATVASVLVDYLFGVPLPSTVTILTSGVLLNSDIVMSENTKILDSRYVMSHEYGHYLFCSMLAKFKSTSVSALIESTIAYGDDLTSPIRYLNEGVADFFTGQVAGAADYSWLSKTYGDRYCLNNKAKCFDKNLDGVSAGEGKEDWRYIGIVATLLHDLVDGRREGHRAHVPGNADLWELGEQEREDEVPPLVLAREQYGSFDDHLERVALSGPAILRLGKHFADKIYLPILGAAPLLTEQHIYEALNAALIEQQLTWCDRCRVFALHVPGSKENVQDLWKTCTSDEMLSSVLGPPPEEDLRMSAEPDQSLRLNTCDACPAGFFSDQDGSCRYCPEDAVVQNECQACKADVLIDGAEASDGAVKYSTLVSAAEDNCPDLFVLEVKNMDRLPARGIESVSAEMGIHPDYQGRFCSFPYTMTMQRLKKSSIARVQSGNGIPCTSNPIVCGLTPCLNLPAFELGDFSHDVRWLTPRLGFNYVQLNLHKPAVIH